MHKENVTSTSKVHWAKLFVFNLICGYINIKKQTTEVNAHEACDIWLDIMETALGKEIREAKILINLCLGNRKVFRPTNGL